MIKHVFSFAIALLLCSCSEEKGSSASAEAIPDYEPIFGTLYDARDGHTYKTTVINGLEWMAENLNYYVFHELCTDGRGDIIECDNRPFISYREINSACYDENPVNCERYGRLYWWSVAIGDTARVEGGARLYNLGSNVRGICPEGWRIPTESDYREKLWYFLLARHPKSSIREIEALLRSVDGWPDSLKGTDEYGFNLKPSGYGEGFHKLGECAVLWTVDEYNEQLAYVYDDVCFRGRFEAINKTELFSVRCVRDYPAP